MAKAKGAESEANEVLKAKPTAEKKKSLHPALGARQRRIGKGD